MSEVAYGFDAHMHDDDDRYNFVYDCGYRYRHNYDWPDPVSRL